MNDSIKSLNADSSINSKETNISLSSENQNALTQDLQNKIIQSISSNLHEIIKENIEKIPNFNNKIKKNKRDIFLNIIPNITIEQYLNRIYIYTKMEISSLIISIIYIDRFCKENNYYLSYYSIYRLLLTSCLLSIKFNEDMKFDMKNYAEIAGIPVEIIYNLEEAMFFLIKFNLFVHDEDYQNYYNFFSKAAYNTDNKSKSPKKWQLINYVIKILIKDSLELKYNK